MNIRVTKLDVLMLSFAIIGILSSIINENSFIGIPWICVGLCYIIVRLFLKTKWVTYGILFCGWIEVVWAMLQYTHLIESPHLIFPITGSFRNPAPLGGFLAVTFCLSFALYIFKIRRNISLITMVAACAMLFFVHSRAAWVGCLAGASYVFILKYGFNSWKEELGILVLAVCIIVLFIGVSFHVRKDSANGRVLIWKVSMQMIKDAPVFGHGIGTFEKKYMYYQANYFKGKATPFEIKLADNVIYPYNEILHIWVELGCVGLLIFLFIVGCVIKASFRKPTNIIYTSPFVSLFTFSLFSYPSHIFLLLLLYPMLLGCIEANRYRVLSLNKTFLYGLCFIMAMCLSYVLREVWQCQKAKNEMNKLLAESLYIDSFRGHLEKLNNDSRLIDLYAQYSFRHYSANISLHILKLAEKVIPTSELMCDLGDVYLHEQQTDKAIQYYQLAHWMIPNRIIPLYKLYCLYKEVGDHERMSEYKKKILSTQSKVENTQTLKIKKELITN